MKVNTILIDGSGSMSPAWYTAWDAVFRTISENLESAFYILLFKTPRALTEAERSAVVASDEKFYAIIDVARMLEQHGIVEIDRAPDPATLGIRFSGYTPLLAAITESLRLIRSEIAPEAVLDVYVVSDNRDSLILREPEYHWRDSDVVEAKREARARLVLIPVGNALFKYTSKYDSVEARDRDVTSTLLDII